MIAPLQDQRARATSPALVAAQQLDSLGYRVTPVAARGKKAYLPRWSSRLIPSSELAEHFDSNQNVGILLGPDAGGIVDIDLDHPIAIELAPAYLPATGARFGRESARASHWMYRVSEPAVTQKVTAPKDGPMAGASLLELRAGSKQGTCQQTVGPGSVHQDTGELIEWEPGADGVAAEIDLSALVAAFNALAADCLAQAEATAGGSSGGAGEDRRHQGKSGDSLRNATRNTYPAPDFSCLHLSSPVPQSEYASVDDLIEDCLPASFGERRIRLFQLVRGLKFNLGFGESPEIDRLRKIFNRWYRRAEANMSGDSTKGETWAELLDGYEQAKYPLGFRATVEDALAVLEQEGAPEEAYELFSEEPEILRVIGVCWVKQHIVGDQPFTFSSSECAKAYFGNQFPSDNPKDPRFGRLRRRSDRLRKRLERLGYLECVDRGKSGHARKRAARYRYVGRKKISAPGSVDCVSPETGPSQ